MKKILLILLLLIFTFMNIRTIVFAKQAPPKIASENAILMDGTTGKILYSKNAKGVFPPASTTKLMTALLALEKCKLEDMVIVGKKPTLADGSKAGIMENEELTVKDLLYGLLFVSGNDCADALAEHMAGSVENFAAMMNKRAGELGLVNTNFVNPSGLYDHKQRSTVKDLALIMKDIVKHPEYSQIASDNKTYYIIPGNNTGIRHTVSNEIKMAWKGGKYYYEGIEGGKTGYTVKSKFSYVVSAKRNGKRLIVALHSSTKCHYPEAIKLLDYGFKNFED
jgi:D-alanyl-D-alanine carboxypeptidase